MQSSDPAQRAVFKESQPHPGQSMAALRPDANDEDQAQKSAARLAAEAAFATPVLHAARPTLTQVTVRRTRAVQPIRREEVDDGNAPSSEKTRQAPRVFRVVASQTGQPSQPEKLSPAFDRRLVTDSPSVDRTTKQLAARTRRVITSKHTGPAVHEVQPMSNRIQPEHEAENEHPQWRTLSAELARVGLVLDQIKRAQSFKIIDDNIAVQWRRITRQIHLLRLEIQAQLS